MRFARDERPSCTDAAAPWPPASSDLKTFASILHHNILFVFYVYNWKYLRQNIILIVYMILSAYELRAVFILFAFIISFINLNRLEIGEDKY